MSAHSSARCRRQTSAFVGDILLSATNVADVFIVSAINVSDICLQTHVHICRHLSLTNVVDVFMMSTTFVGKCEQPEMRLVEILNSRHVAKSFCDK